MTDRTFVRREPPRFRLVTVRRVDPASPRLLRVSLTGPELEGFALDLPAASVRVLIPPPGSSELIIPAWNGNEFLLPDGERPTIRTLTPRHVDPATLELDVEIVVHGNGAASRWASAAGPGTAAAISGPGRGYAIERTAPRFVLAGDETAIPAISQLLELLPPETPVDVHVEVSDPAARLPLPEHPLATVTWHDLPGGAPPGDALVQAMRNANIDAHARVWAAGEAAAVQRIRRNLFQEREMARSQAVVRGYWKHGRGGDADDA